MIDYKLSPKAERYFKKLKDKELKRRYHDAIITIRTNPVIGIPKKGNLKGIFGYELIEKDGELIIIILAGTRENFYNELNVYLKKRREKNN